MHITYPPTYHFQVAKRKMEMLFVRGDGVILVCPIHQLGVHAILMCISNRYRRRLEHSILRPRFPKLFPHGHIL